MIAQAQPESALHWLYTNAPAAWIAAIVAIATLIVGHLRRHRSKRIVVRQGKSVSFLSVDPAVRSRITTTFNGRAINDLSATLYEVYNEGSDPIQKAVFTVTLPEGTVVLNATVRPLDCEPKCEFTGDNNRVTVSLPYLNPIREHAHLLKLAILADGDTAAVKANGSGEGWSVRYEPSPSPGIRKMRKLLVLSGAIGAVTGVAVGAYSPNVRILMSKLSLKPVLVGLPLLGLFAVALWVASGALAKKLYRTDRREGQKGD